MSEWKAIADELLDYGEWVLGAKKNEDGIWEACVVVLEDGLVDRHGASFAATHWMPLPEPSEATP